MKKKIISLILTVVMVLSLCPALVSVAAQEEVSYLKHVYNEGGASAGIKETVTGKIGGSNEVTAYTEIETGSDSNQDWNEGWHVVTGEDVVINGTVKLKGEVNLILSDNSKLTINATGANKALHMNGFNLNIFAQSTGDSMGKLVVTTATVESCIYPGYKSSGNITINGGNIDISSTASERGISVVYGNLIINDGIVKTTGTKVGFRSESGNVILNGGTITSTCSENGIRSDTGNIIVNGGDSEFKGNKHGIIAYAGNVIINGGELDSTGGEEGVDDTYAGICAEKKGTITITGGTVNATGLGGSGYGMYALGNIDISDGSVNAEGGSDGIYSSEGIVTVKGGTVNATGHDDTHGGIVAKSGVVIEDGDVTATGGIDGIYSKAGDIVIKGGEVKATGNTEDGYAIRSEKNIRIDGGKVEAIADHQALKAEENIYIGGSLVVVAGDDEDGANSVPNYTGEGYTLIAGSVCQIGSDQFGTVGAALNTIKDSTLTTIQLTGNPKESITISETQNIILDLNGFVFSGIGKAPVITNHGSLTIIDNDSAATHTGTYEAYTGGIITGGKGAEGTLQGKGGAIITEKEGQSAGGAYVAEVSQGASLIMEAGTITGCEAENGGAIFVEDGNSFTMNGGLIVGNNAGANGGGVYVAEGATFNFNGGSVAGNNATSGFGGGIFTAGTMTIKGTASVSGNTTGSETKNAGNLAVVKEHPITLDGYTGSVIGVTLVAMDETYKPVAGAFADSATSDDVAYFTSEDDGYKVKFVNGKLVLADVNLVTITADPASLIHTGEAANGDLITKTVKDVDDKAVTGLTYIYTWYKGTADVSVDDPIEAPTELGDYLVVISVANGQAYTGSSDPIPVSIIEKVGGVCKVYNTTHFHAGENLILVLNGKEAGVFDIIRKGRKYQLFNPDSRQYLAFDAEALKVIESDEAYSWNYDDGLYTTLTKNVSSRSKTKKVTSIYYLAFEKGAYTLRSGSVRTRVIETIEFDDHDLRYRDCGDYHTAVCRRCGETVIAHEKHSYNEKTSRCECGKSNPAKCYVSDVEVKTKTETYRIGWFFRVKVTEYKYSIKPKTKNVHVAKIEYSRNQKHWEKGGVITTDRKLDKFYIRITDSNGSVTLWKWENGKVSKLGDEAALLKLEVSSIEGQSEYGYIDNKLIAKGTTWAEIIENNEGNTVTLTYSGEEAIPDIELRLGVISIEETEVVVLGCDTKEGFEPGIALSKGGGAVSDFIKPGDTFTEGTIYTYLLF